MEEKFYEVSLLGCLLAWLLRFTPLDTTLEARNDSKEIEEGRKYGKIIPVPAGPAGAPPNIICNAPIRVR